MQNGQNGLVRWSNRDLTSVLRDPFTSFWDDFFVPVRASAGTTAAYDRTEDHLDVSWELPGVKREDVTVEIHGKVLRIHGSKKGTQFEYHETVPDDYDNQTARASMQDGVLTIRFDRCESAKPKKITIKEKL